jgi:hypothetical protein
MSPVHRRILTFLLAAIGQLALVLATSADGWRGPDASAHVEQHGTQLHHAHNESTCPGCVAQSLHGRTEPPTLPVPNGRASLMPTVTRVDGATPAGEPSSNGSRAPPVGV